MGAEFNMEKENKVVKRNGFETPFDILQVASWFVVAFLAGSFIGAFSPLLPEPWDTITLAAYVVALLGVLGAGFETGRIDPIDPCVALEDDVLEEMPDLLKCSACVSRVNKLSRHCLICDKCIVDYDHHCRWLNNCVGEANYRSFIVLITSVLLLVTLQVAVSMYLFIQYVGKMEELALVLTYSSVDLSDTGFFSLVCINAVLGLPALMMVTHLFGFHVYLAYYGLTTYNYVMQVQAEERRVTSYFPDSDSESVSTDEDDAAAAGPQSPLGASWREGGPPPAAEAKAEGETGEVTPDECLPGQIGDETAKSGQSVIAKPEPRGGPVKLEPIPLPPVINSPTI